VGGNGESGSGCGIGNGFTDAVGGNGESGSGCGIGNGFTDAVGGNGESGSGCGIGNGFTDAVGGNGESGSGWGIGNGTADGSIASEPKLTSVLLVTVLRVLDCPADVAGRSEAAPKIADETPKRAASEKIFFMCPVHL
jgi:hypothetical protein